MKPNKDSLKNIRLRYLKFLPDFKAEKARKITTLIMTLASLSFFGLFAINPTLSTIAELNKELDDMRLVDQRLSDKINNLTVLQQKYTNLQADLPIIFTSIPKDPEVPLFVAQTQAVANSASVSLESLQTFEVEVNKNPNLKKYSSFSFALTADGNYNNLNNFLSNLSNMQRIVEVDIISLTRKTGSADLLQLTLKGKTFFIQ